MFFLPLSDGLESVKSGRSMLGPKAAILGGCELRGICRDDTLSVAGDSGGDVGLCRLAVDFVVVRTEEVGHLESPVAHSLDCSSPLPFRQTISREMPSLTALLHVRH